MSVVVKYGDYDFPNLPTPFVTFSEEAILNGEKWGTREVFNVRGQISGCSFEDIRKYQKDVISGFSRDFKTFSIGQVEVPEAVVVEGSGDESLDGLYYPTNFSTQSLFRRWKKNPAGSASSYPELSVRDVEGGFTAYMIANAGGSSGYRYRSEAFNGYALSTEDALNLNPADYGPYSVTLNGTAPAPTVRRAIASDFEANPILLKNNIKVENISFPESRYVGLVDYEITLSHFPEDYYSNFFGVNDPVNEWSFNEQENGILEITHNISCKGFNTNGTNALQNAKNFVNSNTGVSNMPLPQFICKNTFPNYFPCLDSFTENIDRIRGIYGITENYISDLNETGRGTLKYSVEINSGIDSFSTASINGEINGCKNQEFSEARAKLKSFDIFNTVASIYEDSIGYVDLNATPINSGVSEDPINKKINFNAEFTNDHSPETIFDVSTNINSGQDLISVSLNGNIRSRGDIKNQWQKIQERYSGFDSYSFANTAYLDFNNGNPKYPLNPVVQTSGVTRNKFEPSISFSINFDNRQILPSGFISFDKNISIKPSLRAIKEIPIFDLDGDYDIIDLLFDKRASLNIRVDAESDGTMSSQQVEQSIKNEVNSLVGFYGVFNELKLSNYSLTSGNTNQYSLNGDWTFDTQLKVTSGQNYAEIENLKIK